MNSKNMKKYQIIYADPPWDYTLIGKNFGRNITKLSNGKFRPVISAKDHYETMLPKEIANLEVAKISDKNCLLFLWATSPFLDEAIKIMERWGFGYKTIAFVWYKQAIMPGAYTMSSCEICLVGKKGIIPKPRGARNIKQFLSEPRNNHSQKPTEIRNRINQMFPTQNKIELFARKPKGQLFEDESFKGWDVWGNEVKSDIKLT
jgi:N6-adenosine-specific RNA methylase IME4